MLENTLSKRVNLITGRRLILFRGVVILLALLMLGVGVASYIAYIPIVGKICTLSEAQCQRQLQFTPAEVDSFEKSAVPFEFAVAFRYTVLASATSLACALGLLIMARKSDDWMALLVALFLISFSLSNGGPTSAFTSAYPSLVPLMQGLKILQASLLILFFILFPNGRVSPNWMHLGGPLVYIFYIGTSLVPNMIEIVSQSVVISILAIGGSLSTFIILMVSQVTRYRYYSNSNERQQTRWVVFGIVLYIATQIATVVFILPFQSTENRWLFFFFGTLGFNASQAILPLAIGFAVLRFRLFDIDIIIRRTVQYSILTGLLALVYFGGVVLFQGIFRTASGETSSLAVVLSTLIIAALFAPLRRRIQNLIDRRFFRQKYDAAQVLAQFAQVARDEVEMEKLAAALVQVIQETVQPEAVSVWLKPAPNPRRNSYAE